MRQHRGHRRPEGMLYAAHHDQKTIHMKTHTKEFFENLTPEQECEVLREGNKRFVSNLKINRNLIQQVNDTANGQYPFAVVLSCMDSRTSAELIFDQGLGDIFSIRVAGNVVNDDVLGSMEYAPRSAWPSQPS